MDVAKFVISYFEEPVPKILLDKSYWTKAIKCRFLFRWLPFYYDDDWVSLRKLLLYCEAHFSDRMVWSYKKGSNIAIIYCGEWRLRMHDEILCSLKTETSQIDTFILELKIITLTNPGRPGKLVLAFCFTRKSQVGFPKVKIHLVNAGG